MHDEPLVAQGLELALVGMGTVFAFLVLLIFATLLMSRLAMRLSPGAGSGADVASPAALSADDETIAVIGAAIHRHRRRRGLQARAERLDV